MRGGGMSDIALAALLSDAAEKNEALEELQAMHEVVGQAESDRFDMKAERDRWRAIAGEFVRAANGETLAWALDPTAYVRTNAAIAAYRVEVLGEES
jgi:hypothetical protein